MNIRICTALLSLLFFIAGLPISQAFAAELKIVESVPEETEYGSYENHTLLYVFCDAVCHIFSSFILKVKAKF